MDIRRLIESLIYALLVVLIVTAVALVAASPPEFTQTDLVYKGF
jgi:hypothetical protein